MESERHVAEWGLLIKENISEKSICSKDFEGLLEPSEVSRAKISAAWFDLFIYNSYNLMSEEPPGEVLFSCMWTTWAEILSGLKERGTNEKKKEKTLRRTQP